MSDVEPRQPLDDAYVEAERLVNDGAARAARRARVLAAVTTPAAQAPPVSPARRIPRWRPGWAAAAAVGGLGVLVATFASRSIPPAPAPDTPLADGVRSPGGLPSVAAEPAPASPSPAVETRPVLRPTRQAAPPVLGAAPPAARDIAPPLMDVPPPPPLPLPPTPAPMRQSEASPAVEPSQDKAAPSAPAAARRSVARPEIETADTGAAATLRSAAAAGRTAEVEAALARGVPVDAPDTDGDTALMLSVRGGHVATAALLRRRGADPLRLNRAGDSPAALALGSGDPRLEEALRAPRP